MTTMPARDTARWARESLLAELDCAIRNKFGQPPDEWDFDMEVQVYKERNRIARLFKLPEIKQFSL